VDHSLDWWRGGVIYQIYPRSFMDASGDGVGDLRGIRDRLAYVADLGVDAIWLSPFFTSPMADFGYDVADYRGVDPLFGTLEDFCALLEKAHALGLRVIIDQVLSHSSDRHPWFEESRQSRDNPRADWYVWADPRSDGTPPNNWLAVFGGPAWQWDARRGQYYLHNFLPEQPDLNFHHPAVRTAQLENLRFWLDLGVDGFRFDVVAYYFHDQRLRDNPPRSGGPAPGMGVHNPYAMQQHRYDVCRPENLDFLREVRALLDRYPGSTSVGEITGDDPVGILAQYTAGEERLHTGYSFALLGPDGSPDNVRRIVRDVERRAGQGWPCWALSNHDVVRAVSRWGRDQEPAAFARILVALLGSLRGTPGLYQGDELGLPEAELPFERLQDPYGIAFWPRFKGRDGCRTPFVWTDEAAAQGGFSTAEPWLPLAPAQLPLAVSRQQSDPQSTLHAVRRFLRWRRRQPALLRGDLTLLEDSGELLCWTRRCERQALLVALNLTGQPQRWRVPLPLGAALEGHGFEHRLQGGELRLGPCQAFFAELA